MNRSLARLQIRDYRAEIVSTRLASPALRRFPISRKGPKMQAPVPGGLHF
jgi:hypothetical protein